jgi:hypothetical protein
VWYAGHKLDVHAEGSQSLDEGLALSVRIVGAGAVSRAFLHKRIFSNEYVALVLCASLEIAGYPSVRKLFC